MTLQISAQFIEEMKQRLSKEKEALTSELKVLAERDDGVFAAKFPDYGRNDEENANEVADYQALSGTTKAAEDRLEEVEAALQRIKQGTYGVTRDGTAIPEERLRANPAATTVIHPKL